MPRTLALVCATVAATFGALALGATPAHADPPTIYQFCVWGWVDGDDIPTVQTGQYCQWGTPTEFYCAYDENHPVGQDVGTLHDTTVHVRYCMPKILVLP